MRHYSDPFEALLADVVCEAVERNLLEKPLDIYPDLRYIGVEEDDAGLTERNNVQALGILVVVAFAVLTVCKLGNVGDIGGWSWWWVTVPLWGSTIAYYVVLGLAFVASLFVKKSG